jgi:hypothetical protein
MTPDPFIHEVLAPGTPQGRQEALLALIRHRWQDADRTPDADERRRALHAALLALLRQLESLLEAATASADAHLFALVRLGLARWNHLVARFRHAQRHRVQRRVGREAGIHAFPLRDPDHGDVHVLDVDALSQPDAGGHRHPSEPVLPFLDAHVRAKLRAGLYRRWLRPGRLEPRHLRAAHESALLGQWGVFAARPIPAGTCVGVFGGLLLDEVDGFALRSHRHAMSVSAVPGRVAVNGENVLSLVNTLFEADAQGTWVGHPARGYNADMLHFDARLAFGWQARIVAGIATEDIAAGTELRWNYRLGRFPNPIQWQR